MTKKLILVTLLITSVFTTILSAQTQITYSNSYTITITAIENEADAKIAIGHLRLISKTVRCDFNDSTNTFSIKTNTKLIESYLNEKLLDENYTLTSFNILYEN
jgi:hypothetical protein